MDRDLIEQNGEKQMAETKIQSEKTQTKEEKVLTPEQEWNQANISNNFIFYKVMRHNPDVCKELLEILLEMEIDHIEIRTEETVEVDFGSKSIRMDVYAKNNKQAFNIEMQTVNKGDLPERARYYQGIMDVDCMESGQEYKALKDSYVIFICLTDIFKKGLPVYSFENLCREDNSIQLKDRAVKYFFIADNCAKISDNGKKLLTEKQQAFLSLVSGKAPTNKFTERVAELAEDAKHNTQWRKQYMDLIRELKIEYESGKEAGIIEGAQQKAIEAAQNMLKKNMDTQTISECVGLPVEKVQELKSQLNIEKK